MPNHPHDRIRLHKLKQGRPRKPAPIVLPKISIQQPRGNHEKAEPGPRR